MPETDDGTRLTIGMRYGKFSIAFLLLGVCVHSIFIVHINTDMAAWETRYVVAKWFLDSRRYRQYVFLGCSHSTASLECHIVTSGKYMVGLLSILYLFAAKN